NAEAINSPQAHLNFITNVIGWTGYNFNPPEIIGVIYISYGNIWVENGAADNLPSPSISLGKAYTVDINISESAITARSSSDNKIYSHSLSNPPDPDRQVAVGGWGGDTEWGKLTIEGEVNIQAFTDYPDRIDIITGNSLFSPVIEVTGNPVIEWIFGDGTTSSSIAPVKNYGTMGVHHNFLKVTPWSAVRGINLGYDAADGGYGGFAMVENQNVLEIRNLPLAKENLQYLCASYSPLYKLDLSEFQSLRFIELLFCRNLADMKLGSHPLLERICVEDCNLGSLDLSGCPGLEDIRASTNRFTTINWGNTGSLMWHLCIRSNPQLTENFPDYTRFPLLRDLLIWDDSQTGAFVWHSPVIQRIDAYGNNYSSADVSGCPNLSKLSLSGSKLNSISLGNAESLKYVYLDNCLLSKGLVDYVLKTLDEAGLSNGELNLTGNSGPSLDALIHYQNLKDRGWTASINDPVIDDDDVTSVIGKIIVSSTELRILLADNFINWKATVYNLTGNIVASKFIESDILTFDITRMPPGMYLIVLSYKDLLRVSRFVKQ
ncbi:MAG: T9SS type A sorting domain-containing protein, partial [Bacteroidales bacterium]|nr:T9SS type A sorting domain-containing protein [Bacteroidales bacterium]